MARAVHPQTYAGPDGAVYRSWLKAFVEAVRRPWFFATVPTASRPVQALTPEPFESLKARSASGVKGCLAARAQAYNATLRGLEVATGKQLPTGCFR